MTTRLVSEPPALDLSVPDHCPDCEHDSSGYVFTQRKGFGRRAQTFLRVRCNADIGTELFGDVDWCDCDNAIHANAKRK